MMKDSIQIEHITIVNIYIYGPRTAAPQYIWQIPTAINGETDSNTAVKSNFNIHCHPKADHADRKSIRP